MRNLQIGFDFTWLSFTRAQMAAVAADETVRFWNVFGTIKGFNTHVPLHDETADDS